ncbi:MAG TPA: PQQ-binding-like beta-propeller repeat protein [Acidimicrobiales bacterium]|nr:PQQ-binding-like beta-propeller repeat protein [Acidimicrobiales bacterium]
MAAAPAAAAIANPKPSAKTAGSAVTPDPCPDVADHITPSRSGYSCTPLAPNAGKVWSITLNGQASYPIIAGGRVFETTSNSSGSYGGDLYAIDGATGNIDWGPVPLGGTYYDFPMAYDNGTLFVDNFDGQITAFNPATGAQLWATSTGDFSGEPVATGGVIYVQGSSVYAVSESTGAILWSTAVDGDGSAVGVDSTGVYDNGGCSQTRLSLAGAVVWNDNSGCSGGGGGTSYLGGGLFFSVTGNRVVNESTGAGAGTFSGTPAFDGGNAFIASGTALYSETVPSLTPRFSVTLPSSVTAGPVIANGVVYVGTANDEIYGLSTANGAIVSTKSLPGAAGGGGSSNPSDIGIGDNLLVVPTGATVTAFAGSGINVVPGTGPCTLTISGVYQGDLNVKGGTACLEGATVTGQLVIYPGAQLVAVNSSLTDLLADKPAAITACGDSISGPVLIVGSSGFVLMGDGGGSAFPCAGNTMASYVILGWVGPGQGNTGGLELGGNQISSTVALVDNSTPTGGENELDANTITGALLCSGNNPAVVDGGLANSVTGTVYGTCQGAQASKRATVSHPGV